MDSILSLRQKKIRQLFWILLLCCSLLLSVFLFHGVIDDYLKFKTVSATEEVIGIDEVEFPTITICNLNSVSRKKLRMDNLTEEVVIEIYNKIKTKTLLPSLPDINETLEIFKSMNITTQKDFLYHFELEMKDLLEDPAVRMVKSIPCSFRGNNCTVDDFYPIISERYGICEQFNSLHQIENQLHAKEAGIESGLQLFLNIHSNDLLINRVPYKGLALFIHPFGSPFDSSRSKMVPIPPGTMNFVHVKMSSFELLPKPYHNACVNKQKYLVLTADQVYSKPLCEQDCLMKKMLDMCGCLPLSLAHHDGLGPLCTFNDFPCEKKFNVNIKKEYKQCVTMCPFECNYTKYEVSSAPTTLGTRHTIDDIMTIEGWNRSKVETKEYINENIVGVDISFSDISFKREVISPAVTWSNLLGSVGGNLGLCLGASLITFVEAILFMFDVSWNFLKTRFN